MSVSHHADKYAKCPCEAHLALKNESITRTAALKKELQKTYCINALKNVGCDAKKKWRLIREFWPYICKSNNIQKIGSYTDAAHKATTINEIFTNIGHELANTIPVVAQRPHEYVPSPHYPPVFEFDNTDLLSIATLLQDLKPSSSCRVDGLTSKIIKTAGPSIVAPIHHVLNLCIDQISFPNNWKIGCVTPPPTL